MNQENQQPVTSTVEPCPICHGSGELEHVDEEVGCRIAVPCWRCAGESAQPPDRAPPDSA